MRGRSLILIRGASLAAAAVLASAAAADAANLNATPSITLDGAWTSNALNAPRNEVSDYFLRATPGLAISLQTQSATVNLSSGLEAERYIEHEELNRTTATKNVDLSATDPIRITPRFSVRPAARFVETRDALRRNELSATPVPGLPPSETLVTTRTTVREYSGAIQLAYAMTSTLDLGVGGGGLRRDYPDHPPGLFDARTFNGNFSLSNRFTPRFAAGFFGDTSYNSYVGRPNSRTYTSGLTGSYVVTERLNTDVRAGATLLRESTGIGDERREEWSPYGRFSLSYANRDLRATLAGSCEMAGGGSLGITTQRLTLLVTLTDRFAARWGWDLVGSVQSNRSTDPSVTEDLVTGEGTGTIRYDAARWASLHLSGNVFRQRSRGLTGDNIVQQSVLLGITVSNTYNVF